MILIGCGWLHATNNEQASRSPLSLQGTFNFSDEEPSFTPPKAETMADLRLERIYNKQQEVVGKLAANPEKYSDSEKERLLNNVLSQYQEFVYENPNYVYGYILYGKLLRQVGEREAANIAFVRANSLDPQIAVVKQQIGNYLVEEGDPVEAAAYFASAIDLDPTNALYRYQLGETLYIYRSELVELEGIPPEVYEEQMLEAFGDASRLAPDNRQFLMRYTEAFFDVSNPDWEMALANWNNLENSATDPVEVDIIRLQKARVLLAMDRDDEALAIARRVTRPSLQAAKAEMGLGE